MNLRKYATILETKNPLLYKKHACKRPSNDDDTALKIVEAKITTKETLVGRYSRLVQALNCANYDISLNKYILIKKWKRYESIKSI